MSLKDEVLSASVAQILQFGIAGLGSVWLAWKLGPKGLGTYAIVLSIAFIASRPVNGMSIATKQRAASQDKTSEMTLLILGVSILFSVLCLIGGFLLGRMVEGAAIATIVLYAPMNTMGTLIDVGRRTWVSLSRVVLMTSLQVGLFVIIGPTVEIALVSYIISNIAGVLGMLWLISPGFRLFTEADVLSVWDYAKHSIPANLFGEITDRADILVLGALLGSFSSGLYEVAWRVTIPISFLAMLASTGHMRDVASKTTDDYLRPLNYVSVLPIPFLVGSLFVGEEVLVLFFGEQYRPAWILLVGLALFQVFRSQTTIRNAIVFGEDNPDLVVKINAVVLAVNVSLGAFLAVVIGPIGVVIATVFTEFGQLVWYTKETGGPWVVSGVREQIISAAAMGLVLLPSLFVDTETIPMTMGVIVVGVITYGTVLFFRPRHRQLIRETI